MNSGLPKMRTDLVFSRQENPEGIMLIVKEPCTGAFFRFREAEQFILQQLDGETPLSVVQQRAQDKFHLPLAAEMLSHFIRGLEKSGLLADVPTVQVTNKQQQRVKGSLFYLRFKLLDPDRLFNFLTLRLQFLFTRSFVVCSAALIAIAFLITVSHTSEIHGELSGLFQWSSVPLLASAIFLLVVAHEFAHGVTCKHFGGEVHELGFLLLYFQPAFYCNVSDAWLFPEKSKRLWVAFAGPYFEIFIWSIATLIWSITDVDTSLHALAFIIVASSGLTTFINFNPLIKLDGYYLLSDYLEIPNLRRRSFRYIGNWLKRLAGFTLEKESNATGREMRIYLVYGLIAVFYSFFLLTFVSAKAGQYLIEKNHPVSFAFFAGLLVLKFRRRVIGLFGASTKSAPDEFDPVEAEESGTSGSEGEQRRSKSAQTPVERFPSIRSLLAYFRQLLSLPFNVLALLPGLAPLMRRSGQNQGFGKEGPVTKFRKLFQPHGQGTKRWLGYGLVLVSVLCIVPRELRVTGDFNTLPVEEGAIRAEIDGLVEEVRVDEGAQVHAGEIIARLSDRELRAERAKNEALLQQARAKLSLLQNGASREEVQIAKDCVTKAEDDLKYAQSRLERDNKLFNEHLLSQKDHEDTQALVTTAQNALTEAKSKLQAILRRTRSEEIDAARAEVEGYAAQRDYLQGQVERATIRSPVNGVVATPSRELKGLNHQLVKKGDFIARVSDLKVMTAEMAVSEKEVGDIQVGQKVLVKLRAYPGQAFAGTVEHISVATIGHAASVAQAHETDNPAAPHCVLVSTAIDNASLLLKPGMTGRAKIYCGERSLLQLLTRRALRLVKVDLWAWW